MTQRSTVCSTHSASAGLTLIEVVAAIAIVGTVLVGMVLAKTRHTRQAVVAGRKLEAVLAADELISQWWLDGQRVPLDAEGRLDTSTPMLWRTSVASNDPIEQLGARVVRVVIWQTAAPAPDLPEQPLVTIELVMSTEDHVDEAGQRCATPRTSTAQQGSDDTDAPDRTAFELQHHARGDGR